jgi:hypothetical protein
LARVLAATRVATAAALALIAAAAAGLRPWQHRRSKQTGLILCVLRCLRLCYVLFAVCCCQAIDLKDCDVYSYKSDGETDPFGASRCVHFLHIILRINIKQ